MTLVAFLRSIERTNRLVTLVILVRITCRWKVSNNFDTVMSSLYSCASKNQVNTTFEHLSISCRVLTNPILWFCANRWASLTLASLKTSPSVIQSSGCGCGCGCWTHPQWSSPWHNLSTWLVSPPAYHRDPRGCSSWQRWTISTLHPLPTFLLADHQRLDIKGTCCPHL